MQLANSRYDYTILLTMYANDHTISDVIINGNIMVYSNIKHQNTARYTNNPNFKFAKQTYDFLGRKMKVESFSTASKITIFCNNDNISKTFLVFPKN